MVVEHKVGVELIGLASHETVEPLKAAPQRPTIARATHGHLGGRSEVPLTNRKRCVAVAHEHLRQETVGVRNRRVVAGETSCEFDNARHTVAVVVAAGEQTCAGRRAQRGGVKTAVAQAIASQTIEGWRRDV